jgi:3-oxoacyl-[acyl-carrier-protein] synthase I
MRRVVITGMGIVSSIGNNTQEVLASLHEAKSGITRAAKYAELGFRSQVQGAPTLDPTGIIDRRAMRFLGEGAAWNHVAMEQAIQDSGLELSDVSNVRTGIIMGSGGPSARTIVEAADITRTKGPKRVGPFAVPKAMSSTASATLATWFKIKGVNYSISSACATSNHCIGNAYETIQIGKQDIVFAGGCEELDWSLSVLFDAMGAMSSKYNDTPATASRPYDVSRDGFVIAGGAGVVVLEELEHAKARGAKIYGEIVGYGATSDGYDMVAPSGEGAERCMRMAMATVDTKIDYINPHATSTPAGDPPEIEAIRKVFGTGDKCPPISATKALTGHSLGATGVQEAIYSLLMMQNGVRRPTNRAQAHRQRQARHRALEFLRLRRHQRHAGVQADGCVIARELKTPIYRHGRAKQSAWRRLRTLVCAPGHPRFDPQEVRKTSCPGQARA